MLSRRDFLKFIGAFTVGTIVPIPALAKVAETRSYGRTGFILFECLPLHPGHYTLTWECSKGIYVTGVFSAHGGETFIKAYTDDTEFNNSCLSKEPVAFSRTTWGPLERDNILIKTDSPMQVIKNIDHG